MVHADRASHIGQTPRHRPLNIAAARLCRGERSAAAPSGEGFGLLLRLPSQMEPNSLDPADNNALVVRTIHDIEQSIDEQRDALLLELLCAAWGRTLSALSL